MSSVRVAIISAVVAGTWASFVFSCKAQDAAPAPYAGGVVVAKSRYGNGTISAAVRPKGLGWEVQLPGGRWVYCRRSCAETLRVETIDFFETNAAGAGQLTNECGIFGCLDLKYPR